jgi:hypothetical protein
VEAGCNIIPIVHKSFRGVSPFTPQHEVSVDEKGFLLFSDNEARAVFRQALLFHYFDSGEGAQPLRDELLHMLKVAPPEVGKQALSAFLQQAGLSAFKEALMSPLPEGLDLSR